SQSCRYSTVRTHFLPFSFPCSGHLRDLHSFPTRRSSDLRYLRQPEDPLALAALAVCLGGPPAGMRLRGAISASALILSGCRRARSEEHTSELQSRENLVCRLLLEKKKKKMKKKQTLDKSR